MPAVATSWSAAPHDEAEIALTVDGVAEALEVYARALEDGVDRYLVGPSVKPVFRRFN